MSQLKVKRRWTLHEQVYLLERLGLLLERGYMLPEALRLYSWHLPIKKQSQLTGILNELKEGVPLHETLSTLGFSRDIIGYILFAEKHGDLASTLLNTSLILRSRLTYRKKIEKLLRYPVFLCVIVSVMFFLIYHHILPSFLNLYESMNLQEATFSLFIMSAFSNLPHVLLMILLLIFFCILIYFFWYRRLSPTRKMLLLYKIPIVKRMLSLFHTHYFSSQVSSLLNGGLSVLEALTILDKQYIIPFYREQAKEIISKLTSGDTFDAVLKENIFFEREMSVVISHGQANGKLGKELNDYSHLIFNRFEEKMNKMIAVLQPSLFILIGILVVSVYSSIMIPLFEMMKQI